MSRPTSSPSGGKIVVADGGSTKCHWAITHRGEPNRYDLFKTKGVNPLQMRAEEIVNLWQNDTKVFEAMKGADTIYYYGAGCIGGEANEVIRTAIRELTGVGNVRVESDMMGAAIATLGNQRGIACILGTGSNSCLYDGHDIVSNVPPLGYILGDEGSGADIGKHIVADALKGLLPDDLTKAFFDFAGCGYADIIHRIYREPRANAYLASFAQFAAQHIDREEITFILEDRISSFMNRNAIQYVLNGNKINHIGFVGGIAWQFRKLIEESCVTRGFDHDKITIEQEPIKKMVEHLAK